MMLVNPRSHPWRSKGEKRTICWTYEPGGTLLNYLKDMQDAIRYALVQAYRDFVKDGSLPSPIQVRKEIRTWFYSRYTTLGTTSTLFAGLPSQCCGHAGKTWLESCEYHKSAGSQ